MNTISVVIPLYNRAELIAETLASIEKQSLRPFEVIVVDDHSTDLSFNAVENFKKTSSLNIVLLKNGFKKGVSGASNWGVGKATGDFIAMQDSDDLWTPTHLQKLYEALCRYPDSDIAFSAIEVFGSAKDAPHKNNEFTLSVNKCLDDAFEKDNEGVWFSNKNLLFAILWIGFPFRCQASLMRRGFITKNNLSFDTDISYTQESQFMTLAAYFTSFLYVETIGLRLRRHAENDGDVGYGDSIQKSYQVRVSRLKDFFLSHPISLKEKSALSHRLWLLQSYVANYKATGKGLSVRVETAFELLCKVPTWDSFKSAFKILIGRS